jgi:hypothetical protein
MSIAAVPESSRSAGPWASRRPPIASSRPARARDGVENERLLGPIREVHAASYYAYGARRMWIAPTGRRAGGALRRLSG